jgi:hypothetical protein
MAIPGFQDIMLPLLKIATDEAEHNHAEVRDLLQSNSGFPIARKRRCFQAESRLDLVIV